MNAEHLKTLIRRILEIDPNNKVQHALARVVAAVDSLAKGKNPTTASSASAALSQAIQVTGEVLGNLTATQRREVTSLNADRYFSDMLVSELAELANQVEAAPTVANATLKQLTEERGKFVDGLRVTVRTFDTLRISGDEPEPGSAELEVLIPRDLFDNDLRLFQRELDVLYKIVWPFYELNNETVERIEIRTISTSDPFLVLRVTAAVAIALGTAVKLCLDILNGAYGLRQAMREARGSRMVDDETITKIEQGIQDRLEMRIAEISEQTMRNFNGEEGRRNELESQANRSISLLIERLDHGMQIVPRITAADPDQDSNGYARVPARGG